MSTGMRRGITLIMSILTITTIIRTTMVATRITTTIPPITIMINILRQM